MPRKKIIFKIISFFICFTLLFEQSGFAQVAGALDISGHFAQMSNTIALEKFRPLHLRSLSFDGNNTDFKLILDKGGIKKLKQQEVENSTRELLNYFFIGVSLPNSSFWVNLRPDSQNQIIDDNLAKTDIGRILLEADVQLKKDTAKLTSPDTATGRLYWDRLYKKADELFQSSNITIPTLVRPWIVPGDVILRETPNNAYIYKATLKVLLEEDYLKDSTIYNFKDERLKTLNKYSSELIKELIIPRLTKEINTSKRYAKLRQVFYSLIIAQWFKARFNNKPGLYSGLIDKQNLTGLVSKQAWSKDTYYKEYRKSFEEGEYKFQEPVFSGSGKLMRTYVSGGVVPVLEIPPEPPALIGQSIRSGSLLDIRGDETKEPVDSKAYLSKATITGSEDAEQPCEIKHIEVSEINESADNLEQELPKEVDLAVDDFFCFGSY